MSFEQEFGRWLRDAMSTEIPDPVQAFSFNLFEPAGKDDVKFGIELIGASRFDPIDSDWATEEVWEPNARQLMIPTSYSGDKWEACLTQLSNLLRATLRGTSITSERLRSRAAVAVGFIDGDLFTLWSRPSEA